MTPAENLMMEAADCDSICKALRVTLETHFTIHLPILVEDDYLNSFFEMHNNAREMEPPVAYILEG
jgi:hypothetical protein